MHRKPRPYELLMQSRPCGDVHASSRPRRFLHVRYFLSPELSPHALFLSHARRRPQDFCRFVGSAPRNRCQSPEVTAGQDQQAGAHLRELSGSANGQGLMGRMVYSCLRGRINALRTHPPREFAGRFSRSATVKLRTEEMAAEAANFL
jgi:hypothetical protein